MNKDVYVIGELNVDMIARSENITPEWNKEKMIDDFELVLGSSSAITACGLAGLGLRVKFVSVVGDDMLGRFAVEALRSKGVDTKHVRVESGVKTGVTLSLSTNKDRALLTYMGTIDQVRPEHIPNELFGEAGHVHFGSYYLQHNMREHWPALFTRAQHSGVTTSFDLGWDPYEVWHKESILALLAHTTLFVPSEDELKQALGTADLDEAAAIVSAAGESSASAGAPSASGERLVAIKRGSAGSLLLEGGRSLAVGPYNIRPVDTTGAGDSFNAGLIYGYLHGKRGEALLAFANACGALATLRIGGASSVPDLAEVETFMREQKAI